MQDLVIFGAGMLARLAYRYAQETGQFHVQCFVVDDEYCVDDTFESLPLLPWSKFVSNVVPSSVLIHSSVGYKQMFARRRTYEQIRLAGFEFANIIAHRAYVSPLANLGCGNLIMPGVVVEPGVKLGCNNTIWSNATICHDAILGDHNFIAANTTLGGHVEIGSSCFLGLSCVVLQNLVVQSNTLVGANSLIRHSLTRSGMYYGSPARWIRSIDANESNLII